jgi:hypothetical protein
VCATIDKERASRWQSDPQRQAGTSQPQHAPYQRAIINRDLRDQLNALLIPMQLERSHSQIKSKIHWFCHAISFILQDIIYLGVIPGKKINLIG